MRSTIRPTSRRTACTITPATWRWCAAISRKIPVVLASATPSLETEVNARRGRYQRARAAGALRRPAPAVGRGDRSAPRARRRRGRFISPALAGAVKTAIERGEQALLFLNRRGYAPLTLCRACGFRFSCPNCDAWLVDHRFRKQLVCHHCGFAMPHPPACPKCQAQNSFVAIGPGVERLEEEVRELFPQARVLVLSSDLVASVERMREEFADIAAGRFDIVIGTQLVAKGHHFPMLNLVGVVDADLGLSNGDPRAAERTFQLLHQVVGRAGREAGVGHGFLQTHQPEHPVMRALIAQDREAFYSAEIELRESAHYPPFGRLASIVVSGPDKHDTAGVCAGAGARRAAAMTRCACSAPPKRRSRWCAAATACASWSRRRAISISRPICANGSPPRRRSTARSSSTSTSIRRVFCREFFVEMMRPQNDRSESGAAYGFFPGILPR